MAQHLYEFLDDTKDFLGKRIKTDLQRLPNNELLVHELYKLKEYYKAIKNSIFKALGDIRHNTSAHKTQDGLLLNDMIKNLDHKTIDTNCILVWLLYTIIINFQTNILRSIRHYEDNQTPGFADGKGSFKIELGVDAEFKKNIMIIQGVPPDLAKYLCILSREQIENLQKSVTLLTNYVDQKS